MGSHLPDELLARRAAAGGLAEFEELLRRYRNRVYRICYRMAGNAEDAEDWAQECLVRTYRQLGRYDPALPFAPWLVRVVANTCINRVERQARLDIPGRCLDALPPGLRQIIRKGNSYVAVKAEGLSYIAWSLGRTSCVMVADTVPMHLLFRFAGHAGEKLEGA